MNEQATQRNKLKEQLEQVNHRLEILSVIENKLLEMRELAQRVVGEDLTDEEIKDIDEKVQKLVAKIELLDSKAKNLS